MKLKRLISAILIYLLFLNLLPVNSINAYAEMTEETYSLEYCDFHQLYEDCAIALNGYTLYVLKNGEEAQYKLDGYPEEYIDRIDDYVFFLSKKCQDDEKYSYQIERINIYDGSKTISKLGINFEPYTWIADAKLDTSGNGWLSIGHFGNYSLLKIDKEGSMKVVMSNEDGSYSILLDNQNNIWTDYAYDDPNTQQGITKVFKLLNDTAEQPYSLDGKMNLYNISDNGDMWFNSDEKITRTDSQVNPIDSYDIGYCIQDVQVDHNGNTWVLKKDNQSGTSDILKIENGTAVPKRHFDYLCYSLRVIDDKRMSVEAYSGNVKNIKIFNEPYDGPTVKSTSPVNNSKDVLGNSDIKVTFSEKIKTGENYEFISLRKDQNYDLIPYDAKVDGDTVTITPKIILQGGKKYYVDVPEGAVTNETGDKISQEYTLSFTTLLSKDKTAPKVSASVPKSGSKDVSTAPGNLFVHFSEDIAEGIDFENIQLKGKDDTLVDCEKQLAADTLIVKPSKELNNNMAYSLFIPKDSITDLSGNVISKDYYLNFTTFAKPSFSKINIKNTNVKLGTKIQVDFNQNILAHFVPNESITIINNSTQENFPIFVSAKGKSLYIQPAMLLEPNTDYTLTILENAIAETKYKVNMADKYTCNFKTEDKSYPIKAVSTKPNRSEKDVNVLNISNVSNEISVAFNQKVKPGDNFANITLNNLKAKNADDKKINYAAECQIVGVNSSVLVVKPVGLAENITYTLTVPSGALKDSKDVAMKGNYTLSFTTATSNPVLAVKSSVPKNNATTFKMNDAVKITFNRKVVLKEKWNNGDRAGLEISYLGNGEMIQCAKEEIGVYTSGNTLYIFSKCFNYNTKYTINISKDFVVDMTGKPMENDYSLSYTSVKDKDAPCLYNSVPHNYEYNVPSENGMALTFNEALSFYDAKYITFQSNKNEKITISNEDISFADKENCTLLISFGNKLKDNTRYTVTLKPGAVKDIAGNKSKSTYIITFITSKDGLLFEE